MSSFEPRRLDDAALRGWPLPKPGDDGDKEARGRVLLIAGSHEMPGAVVLAASAAMRAGAGKLQIATCASVSVQVAIGVPESRVISLPQDELLVLQPEQSAEVLIPFIEDADALLLGPGMTGGSAITRLVMLLLPHIERSKTSLILDASAMNVLCGTGGSAGKDSSSNHGNGHSSADEADGVTTLSRFARPPLLTPHAGEMAKLCGISKDDVLADPLRVAIEAAHRWNAVVALKGPRTIVALPDGSAWQHEGGNIGLATSGSGDTLAGIIAGLAARGATIEQACAWGVVLHARAGEELSRSIGPIGYLAREIPDCIPALMERIAGA